MVFDLQMPMCRLSLDQVYDVQHDGMEDGVAGLAQHLRWHTPKRIHTISGRKSAEWYQEHKVHGNYLAFFSAEDDELPGGKVVRRLCFGLFTPAGLLVETLYNSCEVYKLHERMLFFAGDSSWGNIVLPLGASQFSSGEHELSQPVMHTEPVWPSVYTQIKDPDDGVIIDNPTLTQIRGWLLKNRTYHPWNKVRELVKARAIVLYWLDLTKHLMQPGGSACKRDREEFERG